MLGRQPAGTDVRSPLLGIWEHLTTLRHSEKLLHVGACGLFEDGLLDHHQVIPRQDHPAGQTGAHTGGSGNRPDLTGQTSNLVQFTRRRISVSLSVHFYRQVICKQLTGMFF